MTVSIVVGIREATQITRQVHTQAVDLFASGIRTSGVVSLLAENGVCFFPRPLFLDATSVMLHYFCRYKLKRKTGYLVYLYDYVNTAAAKDML